MPTQGGPEEIGALSMGVNVPIEEVAAQLAKVGPIAEKAGEEAGKAFKQGVEKGADGTKWQGEGSAGFVGPPRPTGAAEQARQWGLLKEEAAGINAGGAGGGATIAGQAGGGGAGGGSFLGLVATLESLIATFQRFEKMGEQISLLIGDNNRTMRDLNLYLSENARLRDTQQQTQDQIEQKKLEGAMLVDIEEKQKKRAARIADKGKAEDSWMNNTTLATGDVIAATLWGDLAGEPGTMFNNWTSLITGDFGAMKGIFETKQARTNAAREKEIFTLSDDIKRVTGRYRTQFNTAGILETELGLPQGSVLQGQNMGPAGAEAFRMWVHQNTEQARQVAEWQSKIYYQQQAELMNRAVPRMVPIR